VRRRYRGCGAWVQKGFYFSQIAHHLDKMYSRTS
jgi:hypothetical protein